MSVEIMVAPNAAVGPAEHDAIVVADHAAWLRNYTLIREASNDPDRRLRVVLAEDCLPVVQADIDAMAEAIVRFVSPRAELSRLWRQHIPEMLSDAVILALGLTERVAPPGIDLPAFVLGQAYGPRYFDLFAARSLDASAETRLVWLLLAPPTCPGEARPAVEVILRGRLAQWARRGSQVAGDLAADGSASTGVALRTILARYPPDVRRAVLDAWPGPVARGSSRSTVPVPHDPHVAALPASFRVPLEAMLRPHLGALVGEGYLDVVSGVVPAELDALTHADGRLLRALDREAIRDRFAPLGAATVEAAIVDINLAIRAEQATATSGEDLERAFGAGGFDAVAAFFSDQYVPLRERFAPHAAARARLIDWNEAYSRWLVESYPRLLGSRGSGASPFAADVLHQAIATCLAEGGVPIILLIDGLGWPAFRRFATSAERNGVSLAGAHVALAPLPTVTNIAMTSLVAGAEVAAVGPADSSRGAWPELRRRAFVERFPGAVFGRAGNALQIAEALGQPAPVWVLHTLVVDRLVHDPDVTSGLLSAWLDVYFDELWQSLVDAVAVSMPDERRPDVRIIVATDHGYTELFRDEPVRAPVGLPAIDATARVSGRHRRCLQLEPNAAGLGAEVRAHVADDWFVLEGERYGLPPESIWLVPREQRATAAGTLRAHGGASLDETLVPVASFVLRSRSTPQVILTLEGRLVARSASPAMLTLANVSTRALRGVTVRIPDVHATVAIERIGPEEVVARPVSALADRSGSLDVSATVSAIGEPRQTLTLRLYVEPTEAERLLGEDRLGSFFGEEGF